MMMMPGKYGPDTEGPDIRGNIGRGDDDDLGREGGSAEEFLGGVGYPIRKGELVERASREGAPEAVRRLIERLPDREFGSLGEVSSAIGGLVDEGEGAEGGA